MSAFTLFADESHAGQAKPVSGFYVAAGWIARTEVWDKFNIEWRKALVAENLPVFHMGPCEKGAGDFRGLAPQERRRLQERFIGVIKEHTIFGVVCSVALKPWAKHQSAILDFMPPHLRHFVEPHVFATHGLTVAATRVLALGGVSESEQVSFILDRQMEFQGRVEDLWLGGTLRNASIERHRYLGELTHGDKRHYPGLQAADIVAYEEFRRLSGARGRWQMQMLEKAGQLYHREVINDSFMKIARRCLREPISRQTE